MTDKVKTKHENIYAALAAFQGELPVLDKTATVSFGTKGGSGKVEYKYTPLGDINKVILPLLARHGLSYSHRLTEKGIECVVTHETALQSQEVVEEVSETERTHRKYGTLSSNQISSGVVEFSKSGEMKDVGSRITYARRYTLGIVLGIASEEDKDVEIEEARKENAEKFALAQVRKQIETLEPKDLPKKIEFLQKELATLEEGKKAPSLGLTKENYEELIVTAQARIKVAEENGQMEIK